MPQQAYEIKDPRDGSIFEIQSDHPPTPEEAKTAVAKYRVTVAKAKGQPTMGAAVDIGGRSFAPESLAAGPDAVTLGQFVDDPVGSMQKIGAILKKDVTDPKLWGQAALAYFGPKAVGIVGQVASSPVFRAAASAARPALAKAALGYRGGHLVEAGAAAMDAAKAASSAPSAAPVEPAPAPAPPTETPVSTAPTPPSTRGGLAARSNQSGASESVSAAGSASGKIQLTSEEVLQAKQWAAQGLTPQQILDRIASAREFNAKFGLKMPTPAEKRFPKGMRGRPHSAPEPDE